MVLLQANFIFAEQPQPNVIRTSLSPEFPNGLHYKLMRYLADQLDMELDIFPMPYQRRLEALADGDIDIMVGLKGTYPQHGFTYLQPSYETINNKYFVLRDSEHRLLNEDAYAGLRVAVTTDRDSQVSPLIAKGVDPVLVPSLRQKILLLSKGRVDAFVHFEQSTEWVLKQLNLQDKIVKTEILQSTPKQYFFAISNASPLLARSAEFEAVINQGLQADEFIRIRTEHYENLNEEE